MRDVQVSMKKTLETKVLDAQNPYFLADFPYDPMKNDTLINSDYRLFPYFMKEVPKSYLN